MPTDVAGRACILAATVGTTGDVYQLGGARWSTFDIIASCLAHVGIPVRRLPVLRPAMRLMRRSELLSALGSAGKAKRWQVALAYEAGPRGNDKIRRLNRLLPPSLASLAIPDDEEMEESLPDAVARKARWLQLNGKLPS